MERNSENRNSYGNSRNRRQNDRYNDSNPSSRDQQERSQHWGLDENQWDKASRGRNSWQDNYNDRSGNRLESMGALGNDWTRGRENDEYYSGANERGRDHYSDYGSGRRSYSNEGRSYSNDEGRNRFSDTGSWNDARYDQGRRSQQGFGNSDQNGSHNWWDKTKDEVSGWFGDENAQNRRDRDQQNEHRGKGPKGYVRKDERILEDVHEKLTDDGSVDAGEIEVDVKNGEVFLKGTVKSRYEKRRAEDIIENVSGVKNVENHIKVQDQNSQTGNSRTSGQYEQRDFGSNTTFGSKSPATGEFNKSN